ncbi:hypothetical protein OESDEN_02687 [Oesophagostomum dentatum]|uniref:Protein kinase domain-containing protein n=1 Tax=Oesophagostomum dentatum TaxID=61180 RepID=A0A0B1TPK7_OESDE|nr:hypothetical protein OESDEN_02687 [Oesophagostomum dentatum]
MLDVNGQFSRSFVTFVSKCLTKDCKERPKYQALKREEFYQMHAAGGPLIDTAREFLKYYTLDYLESSENNVL